MKFVITGGAGFIGSHIAKHLVKKNGLVYLENKSSTSITLDSEVECWRSAKAGTIHYGLYRIL